MQGVFPLSCLWKLETLIALEYLEYKQKIINKNLCIIRKKNIDKQIKTTYQDDTKVCTQNLIYSTVHFPSERPSSEAIVQFK